MDITNVNSMMVNYNNSNALKAELNPDITKVPLVSSVDNKVKENTEEMKLNKVSDGTRLQDIFNSVESNSGIVANINMSNNADQLQALYGGNSPIDSKVIDTYNSIQNGTFKPSATNIVTSSPYALYSNVNSMMNQLQTTGNLFNATA